MGHWSDNLLRGWLPQVDQARPIEAGIRVAHRHPATPDSTTCQPPATDDTTNSRLQAAQPPALTTPGPLRCLRSPQPPCRRALPPARPSLSISGLRATHADIRERPSRPRMSLGGLQPSLSFGLSCTRTNTPAPRLRLHPGPVPNATPYGRLLGGRSCVVGANQHQRARSLHEQVEAEQMGLADRCSAAKAS